MNDSATNAGLVLHLVHLLVSHRKIRFVPILYISQEKVSIPGERFNEGPQAKNLHKEGDQRLDQRLCAQPS